MEDRYSIGMTDTVQSRTETKAVIRIEYKYPARKNTNKHPLSTLSRAIEAIVALVAMPRPYHGSCMMDVGPVGVSPGDSPTQKHPKMDGTGETSVNVGMVPGLSAVEFRLNYSLPSVKITAGSPSSRSKRPPPLRYFPPPRFQIWSQHGWFAWNQPGLDFP